MPVLHELKVENAEQAFFSVTLYSEFLPSASRGKCILCFQVERFAMAFASHLYSCVSTVFLGNRCRSGSGPDVRGDESPGVEVASRPLRLPLAPLPHLLLRTYVLSSHFSECTINHSTSLSVASRKSPLPRDHRQGTSGLGDA